MFTNSLFKIFSNELFIFLVNGPQITIIPWNVLNETEGSEICPYQNLFLASNIYYEYLHHYPG